MLRRAAHERRLRRGRLQAVPERRLGRAPGRDPGGERRPRELDLHAPGDPICSGYTLRSHQARVEPLCEGPRDSLEWVVVRDFIGNDGFACN
ncbi:MAG: hypothetical protein H6713_36445 [Myxococcales bacterium]|nr:hypothetical protein [Myxococcales bacterium]